MGPPLLEALLAHDYKRAEEIGDFKIPNGLILSERVLKMRLRQIHASPETRPWLLRAIVIRECQTLCGRIGFHSKPGPEDLRNVAADGIEIGYEVDESFRRQGFAKEAAIRLMRWAYKSHRQRCFILSIVLSNQASLALASSMGFSDTGLYIDKGDRGIHFYFERRLDHWPDEWAST
ncbi:MAG: GNAT family N-acetyltransferase [Candidatus Latescibacteria bacterium]|nr:GNAT family N-acetyltransferase [Candidatus Latescibacterota bacterium]